MKNPVQKEKNNIFGFVVKIKAAQWRFQCAAVDISQCVL